MKNYIETMEQVINKDPDTGEVTSYTEYSKKESADDDYNKALSAWAQKIANVAKNIGNTHSYFYCALENSIGTVTDLKVLGTYMEQPEPTPEPEPEP